jgi:uncharacterized OsmC-like protein
MSIEAIAAKVRSIRQHLTAHPEDGASADSPARARLLDGLRIKIEGPNGQAAHTDMPKGVGGGATAPTPAWLMRAGAASCTASVIALRAADLGIALDTLEVTVASTSDDRGIFGAGTDIAAGPNNISMEIHVAAKGIAAKPLEDLVHWSVAHSPVADALRRALPMKVSIR